MEVFLRTGDEYFMRHLFLSLIQVFNKNYIFIQLEKEDAFRGFSKFFVEEKQIIRNSFLAYCYSLYLDLQ